MLTLFATMTVKPAHMDEACDALDAIVAPTRAEDGCLTFEARRATDGSNRMMIFEEWTGRDALDQHMAMPYVTDLFARYRGWLEREPELVATTPLRS